MLFSITSKNNYPYFLALLVTKYAQHNLKNQHNDNSSFRSNGLTFYRPSKADFNPKYLSLELQKMKNSRVILLNIPEMSRGLVCMALAAHLIGLRAKVVLSIQLLPETLDEYSVSGEKVRNTNQPKFGLKIDLCFFCNFAADPTGPERLQSGQDVPLGFGGARKCARF